MIRLVIFLLGVLALAVGVDWLASRPGTVMVEWQGYVAETSVLRALVILVLLVGAMLVAWWLLRWTWASPAVLGRLLHRRREKRGLDALTSGIIAIGAGDRALAIRYAGQARKALPNEPLTHLLRAQAAHLTGDRATARRIFEAMLASPDTELLGLRGLFMEAQHENDPEASRQFAERALNRNPRLEWPVEALFDLQCRAEDWQGALDTLAIGRRNKLIDRNVADRRRAVLLTAQAQAAEDTAADRALALALEAHRLAPDLIPAAAIAGRVLASKGNTPRAARVLLKTWRIAPHPDLAAAYAYARPGDSPRDRLNRVRHLARLTPQNNEGPIALALTAIEAREWDEARHALEPLLATRLTQRICTLMARIEGEQHGHAGRVREWLARAVNAPRDPAWTADGVVSEHWAPISPVTKSLDAFRWRVPVEAIDEPAGALKAAKVEALVGLGADTEPVIAHDKATPAVVQPAAKTIDVVDQQPAATPTRPALPPSPPAQQRPGESTTVPKTPTHEAIPPVAGSAGREESRPADTSAARTEERTERTRSRSETSALPKTAETAKGRVRKPAETKIFVPPRAPDDPGPESEDAEGSLEIGPFRPSGAKA
jgi:HemY protein